MVRFNYYVDIKRKKSNNKKTHDPSKEGSEDSEPGSILTSIEVNKTKTSQDEEYNQQYIYQV